MPAEETPVSAPLTPQQEEKKKLHLESVQRISNLPVISSGINLTSGVYNKVKVSVIALLYIHQLCRSYP